MPLKWTYNDEEHEWEIVVNGHVVAFVTDEMIERVADPQAIAVRVFNSVGSVPPPLEKLLPPHDPNIVIYDVS